MERRQSGVKLKDDLYAQITLFLLLSILIIDLGETIRDKHTKFVDDK